MTARVFISYRTSDGADKATALARDLDALFGNEQVFLDKDDLPAGSRWRDEIARALGERPILLVLVTPHYLGAVDAAGRRRIDHPDDPARAELTAALAAGAHVVPLMCDGVERTPDAHDLPPPFGQLAELTWRRLRAYDWKADVARLAGDLERLGLVPRGADGSSIAAWSGGTGGGRIVGPGAGPVSRIDSADAGLKPTAGPGSDANPGNVKEAGLGGPPDDGRRSESRGAVTGSGDAMDSAGSAEAGQGGGTPGSGTGSIGPGDTGTGNAGRRRRNALLAGIALALVATGGAAAWAWLRRPHGPDLTGRWDMRIGARGAAVAAGGDAVAVEVVQDGDRLRLTGAPMGIERDPDWQAYRDFWRQRTGRPLSRVRYAGEGRLDDGGPDAPPRFSVAVRLDEVPAGGAEPIDTGALRGEVGPAGRRIDARLWLNSEQAERVVVLRRPAAR